MLKWLQYTAIAASDVINPLATLVGAFMETQTRIHWENKALIEQQG